MGFAKWGIVIFLDLVSKGRLARLDWQERVAKARLASYLGLGLTWPEVMRKKELEK